MAAIRFRTKPFRIRSWSIVKLPAEASAKLPSRGQVFVKGTINEKPFQTALEPDGKGSHWFRLDKTLQKTARVSDDDLISLEIEPSKEWPEPDVPADVQKGVVENPQTRALWLDITPMARWEWIRWIRATNNQETRDRRIEVARSKMKAGERRPCCFNNAMCTEPSVSKGGVLLGAGPVD